MSNEVYTDLESEHHRLKEMNLKSTVNQQGEIVTQIIHFIGGEKRTFHNIISKSIKQGQFTKFKTLDGNMIMVNDQNVLCIEVFNQTDYNKQLT